MSPDRPASGFTLLEVLVALAIVAFGLIAVFGQMNQSATAAGRLRDKTFAHWIATNLLTEHRLSGQLPTGGSTESDDLRMANNNWHYEIKYSDEGIEGIRRADVTVAFADVPNRPVAIAVGYIVQRTQAERLAVADSSWPLFNPSGEPASGDKRNQNQTQNQTQNQNLEPAPTPAPGGEEQ